MKIGRRFERSGIKYEFVGYASKNLMRVRRLDTGEVTRLPILEPKPTVARERSKTLDNGNAPSGDARRSGVGDRVSKEEIRQIREALKEYGRSLRPRGARQRERSDLECRVWEEVNKLMQSLPALSQLARDPGPFSHQSKPKIGESLHSVVKRFCVLAFDSREYGDAPDACTIAVRVEDGLCWARVSDSLIVEVLQKPE